MPSLCSFIILLFWSSSVFAATTTFNTTNMKSLQLTTSLVNGDSCTSSMHYTSGCAGQWWLESESFWTFGLAGPGALPPNITLSFKGSGITIYGETHSNGANYTVLLDGAKAHGDTEKNNSSQRTTLYQQTGLDASITHTVTVKYDVRGYGGSANQPGPNNPDRPLLFLVVDSFEVTGADTTSTGSSEQSSSSSTSTSKTRTSATIIGISTALGTLTFMMLVGGFLLFRRHRHAQLRAQRYATIGSNSSVVQQIESLSLPSIATVRPSNQLGDRKYRPGTKPPPYYESMTARSSMSSMASNTPSAPAMAMALVHSERSTSQEYATWLPPSSSATQRPSSSSEAESSRAYQTWVPPQSTVAPSDDYQTWAAPSTVGKSTDTSKKKRQRIPLLPPFPAVNTVSNRGHTEASDGYQTWMAPSMRYDQEEPSDGYQTWIAPTSRGVASGVGTMSSGDDAYKAWEPDQSLDGDIVAGSRGQASKKRR